MYMYPQCYSYGVATAGRLVASPDLIRRVYCFQYNAILKAICAGVGLGLGPRLPAGLPPNDPGELGLLVLLLGDQGHSVQEGVHLCQCEGAGLAWGHERTLFKERLAGLGHISLGVQQRGAHSPVPRLPPIEKKDLELSTTFFPQNFSGNS